MSREGYVDTRDLPRSLQNALPTDAQRVYQLAYNSALAEGRNDVWADVIALNAVKTKWTRTADGPWVRKDGVD